MFTAGGAAVRGRRAPGAWAAMWTAPARPTERRAAGPGDVAASGGYAPMPEQPLSGAIEDRDQRGDSAS